MTRISRLRRIWLLVVLAGLGIAPVLLPAAQQRPLSIDPLSLPTKRIPSAAKKANSIYKRTKGMVQTYQDCLRRGGKSDECAAVAIFCDLQKEALSAYLKRYGGLASWAIGQAGIFDVFKTTACGADCYWCCLTPTGCHSSFGPSPVINCNPGYGAGSHTIGKTLIVADTGITACLGVPQTCDHYSQCRLASEKGYGDAFPGSKPENTPNPYLPAPALDFGWTTPISGGVACNLPADWRPRNNNLSLTPGNMSMAIQAWVGEQKLRAFAESLARKVAAFLDNLPPDFPPDEVLDLLTLRGCKAQHALAALEPFDGTTATFQGTASIPEIQAQVARRRALAFLATLRILGGVPNLRERLLYVESRLWPCQEKDAYFKAAGITDPDAVLRKTLGPVALRILKTVDVLQDYRLLAVPLPGEREVSGMFDGCELGRAPEVNLIPEAQAGEKFSIAVAVRDVDQEPPALPVLPLSIDWGDGEVTAHEHPAGAEARYTHVYERPGRYRVLAIASGRSGLRGVHGHVVEVTGADPKVRPLPAPLRASLPRVEVFSETTGEAGSLSLTLHRRGKQGEEEEEIGKSGEVVIENREVSGTMVVKTGYKGLGEVVGHNGERAVVRTLVLRPQRTGGRLNYDLRKVYLVLGEISLDLSALDDGALINKRGRLVATQVRAYYKDQPMTPVAGAVTADPLSMEGRLRVPLLNPGSAMPRDPAKELLAVEIDVAPSAEGVDLRAPQLAPEAVGAFRRWEEVAPGQLVAGPLQGVPDDGGGEGGPGCSCAIGRGGRGGRGRP